MAAVTRARRRGEAQRASVPGCSRPGREPSSPPTPRGSSRRPAEGAWLSPRRLGCAAAPPPPPRSHWPRRATRSHSAPAAACFHRKAAARPPTPRQHGRPAGWPAGRRRSSSGRRTRVPPPGGLGRGEAAVLHLGGAPRGAAAKVRRAAERRSRRGLPGPGCAGPVRLPSPPPWRCPPEAGRSLAWRPRAAASLWPRALVGNSLTSAPGFPSPLPAPPGDKEAPANPVAPMPAGDSRPGQPKRRGGGGGGQSAPAIPAGKTTAMETAPEPRLLRMPRPPKEREEAAAAAAPGQPPGAAERLSRGSSPHAPGRARRPSRPGTPSPSLLPRCRTGCRCPG